MHEYTAAMLVPERRASHSGTCQYQVLPSHRSDQPQGRKQRRLPTFSSKGVVTNYGEGGGYKTGGGAREVLHLRKGGAEKLLAILKGGHKKFWGSFYAVA